MYSKAFNLSDKDVHAILGIKPSLRSGYLLTDYFNDLKLNAGRGRECRNDFAEISVQVWRLFFRLGGTWMALCPETLGFSSMLLNRTRTPLQPCDRQCKASGSEAGPRHWSPLV